MNSDAPRSSKVGLYVAIGVGVAVLALVAVWAAAGNGLFAPPRPKVEVPGVGSVDLLDAQRAMKELEGAKDTVATDPETLKALLPASVAGFTRGEVKTSSGGMGKIEGSEAAGRYAKGDANLRLKVTDLGGAGALAGLASGFNLNASSDDGASYERVGKVDGRMTTETYNRATKQGEFAVLVGERFMVSAEGEGVTIDDLKAAVAAVPAARLEGMAKGG